MGKSEDSPSQPSSFFGPTLIVALGGLVAYFTINPSLESLRPDLSKRASVPPPPSPGDLYALHSRLWDDPLSVAYKHSQQHQNDSSKHSEGLAAFLSKITRLNKAEVNVQRYFDHAASQFLKNEGASKDGKFLCLPVLVPGEPYEGDTETRKRITYAVLSALTTCGYELSYPDRLSYVELAVEVDMRAVGELKPVQLVVPVKLFRRGDASNSIPNRQGPDGIEVLWINEDQLGDRPLAAIGQVLEGLYGDCHKKQIDVGILGPVDSDTLLQMAQEDANWINWKSSNKCKSRAYCTAIQENYFEDEVRWKSVKLFSGRATISSFVLDETPDGTTPSQCALSAFVAGGTNRSGLRVVRTIGSDWQLASGVAEELRLRGAWPLDVNGDRSRAARAQHLVLITESDTSYGSAFPAVFQVAFPNLLTLPPDGKLRAPDGKREEKLLHVYTYLRGLDGKIPEEKQESDDNRDNQNKPEGADTDPFYPKNLERIPANGRSQFDYLRRLERDLGEIDDMSRNQGDAGITCIGVVGSDVYDKLLVLRALRKRFPRAWFFSTDLDAALSMPSEYPTTHNLVVASHFGLTLNPSLQRRTMPFRDTYQTATFFSALLALDDDTAWRTIMKSGDPWGIRYESSANTTNVPGLHPLVFEIGRGAPYQLTIPKAISTVSALVHPVGMREQHWLLNGWHSVSLATLVLLSGIGLWCLSVSLREAAEILCYGWRWPGDLSRYLFRVLLLVSMALFLRLLYVAAVDHTNPEGEPFVLFEGISIWPAIIVRYFVIVLSVAFIGKIIYDVRGKLLTNLNELCETIAAAAPAPRLGEAIYQKFRNHRSWRLYLWGPVVATVGFLLFGWLLMNSTEVPPSPYRGDASRSSSHWVLGFAVTSMTYLVFVVLTHLELCRRFVVALGKGRADWSSEGMGELIHRRQPIEQSDLDELLTIRVIAESTEGVGQFLKYPFIALFVLILSQHPAFDKLELPWSLVVIWVLIVAALAWMAHAMRREARHARDKVLDRLRHAVSFAMNPEYNPKKAARRAEQLRQYIAEIENEDAGAFRPWMQDPLVQALALGGSGGLMLIHQLLPFI
jgi:hypothetical protein